MVRDAREVLSWLRRNCGCWRRWYASDGRWTAPVPRLLDFLHPDPPCVLARITPFTAYHVAYHAAYHAAYGAAHFASTLTSMWCTGRKYFASEHKVNEIMAQAPSSMWPDGLAPPPLRMLKGTKKGKGLKKVHEVSSHLRSPSLPPAMCHLPPVTPKRAHRGENCLTLRLK